ncbi:MAG: flagellar hook-length control protein FliK [Parvularculaceae bacterium]
MHDDEPDGGPEDGTGGTAEFAALFLTAPAGYARDSGENSPPGSPGKGAKHVPAPADVDAALNAISDADAMSAALQTFACILPSGAGAVSNEEITPSELGTGALSIRAMPDVTTSGVAANTVTPAADTNAATLRTAPAEQDDAGPHITDPARENIGPQVPEDSGSRVALTQRTDAAAQPGIGAITQADNIAGADTLAQLTDPHGKSSEAPAFSLTAAEAARSPAPTSAPATATPATPPAIEVSIRSMRHDAGSFEFRLDPPELGRLIVEISAANTDNPRATVFADDAQTLELMRRHGDLLSRELERQGFTGLSLHFSDRRDHGAAANMVSTIAATAPADWVDEEQSPIGHLPLAMNAGGFDRTV